MRGHVRSCLRSPHGWLAWQAWPPARRAANHCLAFRRMRWSLPRIPQRSSCHLARLTNQDAAHISISYRRPCSQLNINYSDLLSSHLPPLGQQPGHVGGRAPARAGAGMTAEGSGGGPSRTAPNQGPVLQPGAVVPHAAVLPPTAVLPPGASSHGLSNKRPFSQLSGQTEAPLLPDCACNGAAAATVHTAPVAAIYTVPHTAMPPPASTISTAVPSKSASKSKLRTKRPQGATDLKLVSASNGDGAGTSGAPSMPLYSAAAPPNSGLSPRAHHTSH